MCALLPPQQGQELCRQVTAACATGHCHSSQAIYLLTFTVDLNSCPGFQLYQ